MFAQMLRKVSFWIGVVTATAIPLVPVVYSSLYPPKALSIEQSVTGLASFAVDVLGSMGDGILVMVWMSAFAGVAMLASLIAFIAARLAHESRRTKMLCWLPALLAVTAYSALVAIGA